MVKKSNSFISLKNVAIDDSFFSSIQNTVAEVMIPYQEKVLHDEIPNIKKSHVIENFQIAAGEKEGTYYGRIFQDSDLAKWIEAVAYSLTIKPDADLERRTDEIIALIGRAQEEDGYLNSYFTAMEPERKWKNLRDCHELYCAGHMTEAAVAYYQATGKDEYLKICCKLCDHIERRFGEGKTKGIPGHEEVEYALLRLYKATNQEKYLELASYFIDERGTDSEFFDKEGKMNGGKRSAYMDKMPHSYMQNHKPVREQDKVEGHAVRMMYLLTAMADIAALKNDESLMSACKKMWHNMVEKRMYLTGGIGSSAHGESFTEDYDLPNDTAYAETCAAVGVCFFARQMLEAEPCVQYADILERALYNGTISGMQLDGTKFFYINQLEANPGLFTLAYGHEEYTPQRIGWYDCACCPPNLARLMMSLGTYIWSSNNETIYSHLFVGSNADFAIGEGVKIQLESQVPWNGKLTYKIDTKQQDTQFTLAIRYPGWCKSMLVTVNGERIPASNVMKNGYWKLERKWNSGDTVECLLDLSVRRIYANPLVRANVGCVALMRGPLVYAFEGVDNGEELQRLRIPRDAEIKECAFDAKMLGGIVPIEICGKRKKETEVLYMDEPVEEEDIVLKAIPYYAWANRGITHMRVWMPE